MDLPAFSLTLMADPDLTVPPTLNVSGSRHLKIYHDLVIKGIRFDGRDSTEYAIRSYAPKPNSLVVEHCEFFNFLNDDITDNDVPLDTCIVRNSIFHDIGMTALEFRTEDMCQNLIVENCTFYRLGEQAIHITQEAVPATVRIQNVTIHDCLGGIYFNQIEGAACSNAIITRCRSFGIQVMARDLTQRRQTEAAQHKAEQELESQKALSMRADHLRSLGEMAAGIAHELNQPLVGVRGLAEHILIALQRNWDLSEDKLKDRVTRIVEQEDRMVHIIQHVRMFAREAGKAEVTEVAINEVAKASLDMLTAQLKSHGVDLKADLTDGLPPVMANAFSLEEVILNLLNNARDAVEDRLQTEDAFSDARVWLRTSADGPRVEIEVNDNGAGIPDEILDRVFDPFFTTKAPDKGTGLGLAVSRSIVEEFGGTLRIQTAPGEGTTVTLSLPVQSQITP